MTSIAPTSLDLTLLVAVAALLFNWAFVDVEESGAERFKGDGVAKDDLIDFLFNVED